MFICIRPARLLSNGVTIQKVNRGLDTGMVVKTGQVNAYRRPYLKVFHELEALGIDLYIQAILEVKQGVAEYKPQTGVKGMLYRNPKPVGFPEILEQTIQTTAGNRQVKVCIFTETYFPVMGGGETQVRLLAEGLIAGGHSVLLLTRRSEASLKKQERYGDLDVYRLAPSGGGQLKKWGLLLSSLPALIRLRARYDL